MSRKILIVDDEAHILHVLSLKLRNAGYDVISAVDGEEALDLCLAERPDLVITDYQMPIKTGLELSRELHAHEATENIPIVMITAREFDLAQEELTKAGIAAILAKPFGPREVLGKVQALLGDPQPAPPSA
ncbi:MAG: response regulator [Phycisphaerae bacterium]|jgi:two-component system alkaline phosphatase synthesis response regulator PhoP